ncbi:hypothetical protein [Pontibacter burrus]|uniref:Uncharacterized protein n=1 Tax=Pontibacter burrus TaxID=2704466 RepID=A0A6B3LWS8_9BACT|nr:hypothetical protein [Pontibacter burrus]NEM97937.1 hypothetical protein [Pontibacter burrus]
MNQGRLTVPEYVILTIVLVHLLVGIVSFFWNPSFFELYIIEDGYIENATALSLLMIAIVCGIGAYQSSGVKRAFLILGTIVFIFGCGEEISWGQRILEFSTPEKLHAVNAQGEFNIHNLQVGEVKINKLIFSTVMYSGIFFYFLGLPLLYKYSSKLRNWKYLYIPIPKQSWGWMYLGFFMLPLILPTGKLWELQEFCFSVFLLASVVFQQNPKFDFLHTGTTGNYKLAEQ